MKTKLFTTSLLLAVAMLPAQAQTTVPTPRSAAPDYTPPVPLSMSAQNAPASSDTVVSAPVASVRTSNGAGLSYQPPHAGTWDFYLLAGGWFINKTTMTADNVPTSRKLDKFASGKIRINIEDALHFGIGLGFNITEQLSVHGQFITTNSDYKGVFHVIENDEETDYPLRPGRASINAGDLAVRYDLLQGRFRPFVQASIGYMYIDTGIANGPYYYWWDWYWGGYYGGAPTVSHSYFTLGAAAGVSYYFTKNFYGQLSITANWANAPHEWLANQRISISVGWNY